VVKHEESYTHVLSLSLSFSLFLSVCLCVYVIFVVAHRYVKRLLQLDVVGVCQEVSLSAHTHTYIVIKACLHERVLSKMYTLTFSKASCKLAAWVAASFSRDSSFASMPAIGG
jgi:hypothetical protein